MKRVLLSTILLVSSCLILQAKQPLRPSVYALNETYIVGIEGPQMTYIEGNTKFGALAIKPTAKTGEEEVIWQLMFSFDQYDPIEIRENSDFLTLTFWDNTQLKLRPASNITSTAIYYSHHVLAFYIVTQEQMEKIINSGVSHISLVHNIGSYNKPIKKNKMSIALNDMRLAIETVIDEL